MLWSRRPTRKMNRSLSRVSWQSRQSSRTFLIDASLPFAGDAADGMYFIEEGTVSVRMDQEDTEIEISKLGKGQYFGELALVTHRPRAASVYATEGSVRLACKSSRTRWLTLKTFQPLLTIITSRLAYGGTLLFLPLSFWAEHLMLLFCILFSLSFIVYHFCFFSFFVLCTRSLTRRHLHLMFYCCSCCFLVSCSSVFSLCCVVCKNCVCSFSVLLLLLFCV